MRLILIPVVLEVVVVPRFTICRSVVLALVLVLVLAACGQDGGGRSAADDGRLSVVVSFYPLAEAAQRVGGNAVSVTNLTPAGAEPHGLQLAPRQVVAMEDADLVLYVGAGFQPAVADVAERRERGSVDVLGQVQLQTGDAAAIEAQEAEDEGDDATGEPHAESGLDPHFWLDPELMTTVVDEVEIALSDASPADAETFRANADAYRAELATLDTDYRSALASCARDEIVTSHAAFYYLASRYGLTQLPIVGLSPDAEPSPERLAELADQIETDGVTTVFYETLVSPQVAEALAAEAHVTTAVLNPIEGLTKQQIDDGASYLTVMRDNLAALRDALACT
jgi:zinc transport system substrate-binding protein